MSSQVIVTAEQMRQIEARLFETGMPVAALMEKVAQRISQWIFCRYPAAQFPNVGVLVGPGHNGGDALVVARELHLQGYGVRCWQPLPKLKDLTADHARYAASLGIPFSDQVDSVTACDLVVDGLFGFGLTRQVEGGLADAIAHLNQASRPMISIDLPSGLHTDSGAVLGQAIRATHTLCLGLWKRAFFQDSALDWIGQPHRIDFGIPAADIAAVLGSPPSTQRLTTPTALARLPLPRAAATHKYRVGTMLIVAGSRSYSGAAILAALGAQASGVGMLTLAVPATLKPLLNGQIPEALVVPCPEGDQGEIAHLPEDLDLNRFDAIACGPGLTQQAGQVLTALLAADRPWVLDADGLNLLAQHDPLAVLPQRSAPTVLTPHPGEFKRLFPALAEHQTDAGTAAQTAAAQAQATVVLKGGRTAVADPRGSLWYLADSTPALARGGSGDVLTGLIGGLLAQCIHQVSPPQAAVDAALAGVWWHATAGVAAAQERTELGVDPPTLARYLNPVLSKIVQSYPQSQPDSCLCR